MSSEPLVVAFYSPLGGTQRTTSALLVGSLLAEQGNRVLLVDADVETSAFDSVMALTLCKKELESGEDVEPEATLKLRERLEKCIKEKLIGRATLYDIAMAPTLGKALEIAEERGLHRADWVGGSGGGRLDLLPSTYRGFSSTLIVPASRTATRWRTVRRLYYRILQIGRHLGYDYIIVDLKPGLDALTEGLLLYIRFLVLFSRADELSVVRVQKTILSSSLGPCMFMPPGHGVRALAPAGEELARKAASKSKDREGVESAAGGVPLPVSCLDYLRLAHDLNIAEKKYGFTVYTFIPLPEGTGEKEYRETLYSVGVLHEQMRGFFYNYLPELFAAVGVEPKLLKPREDPIRYAWRNRDKLSRVFGNLRECREGRPRTEGHGGLSRLCAVLKVWREMQRRGLLKEEE